jgi:hypothetical protein
MSMNRSTYTMIGIKLDPNKDFFADDFEQYTCGKPNEKFSLILDFMSGKFAYFGFVIGCSEEHGDGQPSECPCPVQEEIIEIKDKATELFGRGEYVVLIHHFDRWL